MASGAKAATGMPALASDDTAAGMFKGFFEMVVCNTQWAPYTTEHGPHVTLNLKRENGTPLDILISPNEDNRACIDAKIFQNNPTYRPMGTFTTPEDLQAAVEAEIKS